MLEPGDEDVFKKVKNDLSQGGFNNIDEEIRNKMDEFMEVAKKAGCKQSQLISFDTDLPINEIIKCNRIGLTSGASAPERLIQDFISEVKKHCNVLIEEIATTKEKVTFKLPRSLS